MGAQNREETFAGKTAKRQARGWQTQKQLFPQGMIKVVKCIHKTHRLLPSALELSLFWSFCPDFFAFFHVSNPRSHRLFSKCNVWFNSEYLQQFHYRVNSKGSILEERYRECSTSTAKGYLFFSGVWGRAGFGFFFNFKKLRVSRMRLMGERGTRKQKVQDLKSGRTH